MGYLSKQVFKHYSEFECDRQLLLDLGEDDPRWIAPLRALAESWNASSARSGLAELGKAYESSVYTILCRHPHTRFSQSLSVDNPIASTELTALVLTSLHTQLTAPGAPGELYLLEHEWTTPSRFAEFVFGLSAGQPNPVAKALGKLRPDLLVIGNAVDAQATVVSEVEPDGTLRTLSAEQREGRIGISIIDVKHSHEQGVGRGHFIELLYYALALSAYLDELGLRDRFFVRAEGNGIFPKHELASLATLLTQGPRPLVVPLVWRDTYHLFEAVQKRVQFLWENAPHTIEKVPAKIQSACGRCSYLADCKQTHQQGNTPADWDLGLIPYLRQGTAEQLRSMGFRTVGDVAHKVREIVAGNTPQPIYAEIAPLELKAKALEHASELPATPENTAGQRMFSLAIPKYTNVDLFFDLETDPTNEVVFALGFYLLISASENAAFKKHHNAWWQFWAQALAATTKPDWNILEAGLDSQLFGKFVSADPPARYRTYELFLRALQALSKTPGGRLSIKLPGEKLGEYELPCARISYEYSYINGGAGARGYSDGERVVAERAVTQLFSLLTVSQIYEDYCREVHVTKKDDGKEHWWTKGPGFAGFYWSREQLDHVQELLERHLPGIIEDVKLRDQFLALLEWLAPSESGVAHYLQHRKIFNLREFVESSVGLPEIINVTWHRIHRKLEPDAHYSTRFWAEHFNYMDFAVWHELLEERDGNQQSELREKLLMEVRRKLWALREILVHYRRSAGDLIARTRYAPANGGDFRQPEPTRGMHALAQVWYLYSRLNAAMADLDAEYTRTTYPAQSIARLDAAEASELEVDVAAGEIHVRVRGLSANANFSEGSYVFLLAENARDLADYALEPYRMSIKTMVWNPELQGFLVVLENEGYKKHPLLEGGSVAEGEPWFLYGTTSDLWSGRLESLLEWHHVGTSWLGNRLSVLWGVGNEKQLPKPKSFSANAPSVYLFAPELLPKLPELQLPLQTTQHPPPDPSQAEAIQFALSSAVSCVQGPPGTGKSQTIAALIDEFLLRKKGPARVLVTAFSYAALGVVLDKLRRSVDAKGKPTEAAKTKLVFLRSAGRNAIEDEAGIPHVYDLTLPSSSKMELDGKNLGREKGARLDTHLGDRFVLFANAFSLAKLGTPSKSKSYQYELLSNDFGFDLIIVDEASQLPANQLLASAELVVPFSADVRFAQGTPKEEEWPLQNVERLKQLALDPVPSHEKITRYVIVGDHNQLPPVQTIKPPAKLQRALDSAFHYYVLGHGVAHRQLRKNYRSHPTIVEYTRTLDLYDEQLEAFRGEFPYAPLPPPPASAPDWVREVLDPKIVVGALVHSRQHETAVSPLEATMAAELSVAFFEQMKVSSAAEERTFWQEHLGIVAPHNAQGRLIARSIYDRLTEKTKRRTFLDDRDLVNALRSTIYSVEKFQGSDRTFIIGSVALSSRDQLAAEEAFIYDLNRFNVLTSRAKQKMMLLCSESFLDYIPRDRDVFAFAARVRNFAFTFCETEKAVVVQGEEAFPVRWRFRAPGE